MSYILISVCVLTAIGMPLVKAFSDPSALKKTVIGIGGVVVIFLISFFASKGEATDKETVATIKLIEAGLITFYILLIVSIASILYTEIRKAIE